MVVTTSTDHVTPDVVQAGQEAVVKNVSKMYTDNLQISNDSKRQHVYFSEVIHNISQHVTVESMEKNAKILAENVWNKKSVFM